MEFIKNYAKMSDKTEEFLSQMMGHLTLEFDGKTVHMEMPDLKISLDGEDNDLTGMNETAGYKIIFKNDRTVAIAGYNPVIKKDTITVYNFVEPDLMWVYVSGFDAGMSDLNFREYFKRL